MKKKSWDAGGTGTCQFAMDMELQHARVMRVDRDRAECGAVWSQMQGKKNK
jgi:hypothetical protein